MHSVSTRKSGLRAVLDSNILARFLLTPRGFSGRLLGILETGGFTLVTCEAILTEMTDVLARPHQCGRSVEACAEPSARIAHPSTGWKPVPAVAPASSR
jgi:predicted nucleic acid-binding protein